MDQNLKELIQKATIDGNISEDNRNFILKKANEIGISDIEVNIYIEASLKENKSFGDFKLNFSENDFSKLNLYDKLNYLIGFVILISGFFPWIEGHSSSSYGGASISVGGGIFYSIPFGVGALFLAYNNKYKNFRKFYGLFVAFVSIVLIASYSSHSSASFMGATASASSNAGPGVIIMLIFGIFYSLVNFSKLDSIMSTVKSNNYKTPISLSKDFFISFTQPIYLMFCIGTWLFLLHVNNSEQKLLFVLFLALTICAIVFKNKININKLHLVLFVILLIYSALISFDIFRKISGDSYYELSGIKNELNEFNVGDDGYYSEPFGNVTNESTKVVGSIVGYILILCELLAVVLIIHKLTLLIQRFIQSEYLLKTNNFLENNNKKIIYCLIIFLTLNISASSYFAFKNKRDIENQIFLLNQKLSENEKIKNEASSSHSNGMDENNQDTSINNNGEKILIARFIDCEVGDLIHYIFEDNNGQQFDFSALPDNYKLIDTNYKVNPEFENKKFKIKWKAVPDSGGEDSYPYNEIITIELIE
jgi:hypothetical protein